MIYNLTDLHAKPQYYKSFDKDIENNLCYCIAWDGEGSSKKYYSFKDFYDFERIINRINKYKIANNNKEFDIKQRIYYEIIGKMCKVYFDIDIKDENVKITNYEFECFVKNEFIPYFNRFMNSNISYDDLLIFSRKQSVVYISSIHIIVKPLQINKYKIKEFLEYLSFMCNNPIVEYFDTKIYTKNRLFNLPYNTKLTHYLKNTTNPNYFMDLKRQNPTPKDYLVSYRIGLKHVDTKQSTTLLHFVKNILKLSIKNAFTKLKIKEPIERKKVYFKTPLETFDFVLLNLPNSFYTHSNDWKLLTCIFKKYNITDKQFDIWNETSIQNGKNKSWTTEKNTGYYKGLDILQVKSGIPKLKKLLERYLTDYEIIFEMRNNELIEWLLLKTEISRDEITECLSDTNITNNIYDLNAYYSYNKTNGFLLKKEDINHVIGNFYHEVEFKKIYETQKIQNIIEYQNIEDTYELVDNFISNDKKFFCLKAKWGSGKSHFIIKRMVYAFHSLEYRIIFLTENNALNKQIEKSYSTDTFNLLSHIDNDYKILKHTTHNIVCSLESIQKIEFKETDILILDEFESILNHFESDTFDNRNMDKFKLLKNAILKCKKVILTDADISQQRINLIESITNNAEQITTIQANTNNFIDYKFNVFIDKDIMFNQLETEIKKTQMKICVASSVRKTLEDLYMDYIVKYPTKTILKIDTNGALINKQNVKLVKSEVLKNLEDTLTDHNVDILLYSPTIKTGVSINNEYFDKCYAYGSRNSLCVREFIQMLFRARNLKKKEINIGFYDDFKSPKQYISNERIKKVLIGEPSITLFMLYYLNDKESDINKINDYQNTFNYDTDYFKLKVINEFENYHSRKLYTQEFMIRMLYNHNIKLNYVYELKEETEQETQEEEQQEQTETEKINMSRLSNAELIPRMKYIELLYNDEFKKLGYWERTKAKFFYKYIFINGISNMDYYDNDIYDKVNNDMFYEKYNFELKQAYKSIDNIVNNQVDNMIYSYLDKQKNEIPSDNKELDFNKTDDSKVVICKMTLDKLGVDILKLPCYFSNADFDSKLWNDTEYKSVVKEYIDNTIIDTKDKEYSIKTKKNFVSFIKYKIFDFINLSMKYVDKKNTTRPYDKVIINFKDYVVKKEYNGRLTNTDLKLNESQIVKFKKGFLYKINETEKIPAYKQIVKKFDKDEYVYFTTYNLKQSKKILLLKSRINEYRVNSEEVNKNLFTEISNRKIKPYIFKDIEYYNDKVFIEYSKLRDNEVEEELIY